MSIAMDKDRARSRGSAENTPVSSQQHARKQINGNMSSTCLGKRKKVRDKKTNYLQDWLDKSLQQDYFDAESDTIENYMPSCWQQSSMSALKQQNRPLHLAMSDPSVCRYSVPMNPGPMGYSTEPLSLPMYQYPLAMPQQYRQSQPSLHLQRNMVPNRYRQRKPNKIPPEQSYVNPVYSTIQDSSSELQFASLPPVEVNSSSTMEELGNRRRFSDPGLEGDREVTVRTDSDDSNHSSADNDLSPPHRKLMMALVEQVNALKESNARLYRELRDTKAEIEILKQHSLSWSRRDTLLSSMTSLSSSPAQTGGYIPGMLSDVVREVRDAARVREDALLARVRALVEDRTMGFHNSTLGGHSMAASVEYGGSNKDICDIKVQLQQEQAEKSQTLDRLGKVEEGLQNLLLNQTQGPSPFASYSAVDNKEQEIQRERDRERDQERVREREVLKLRRDLQDAMDKKSDAEANSQRLERLVTVLRKKINGVSIEDLPSPVTSKGAVAASLAPSDSLAGSYASSPLNGPLGAHCNRVTSPVAMNGGATVAHHTPRFTSVTMSGPVTDL